MSIVKTITDNYEFYNWLKQSDNYKNSFSLEGARALQEHLEDYSNDFGENIGFDPIAWCCEYSEYENWQEAYKRYGDGTITDPEQMKEFIDERTMTYEFDGGIIIQDF